MGALAILSCVVLVIALWYDWKYGRRNKMLAKIAAVKPTYPLIGSNLAFFGKSSSEVFNVLVKASLEHTPAWRFDMTPFLKAVFLQEPKAIEDLLSTMKLTSKSGEYELFKNWLGEGEKSQRMLMRSDQPELDPSTSGLLVSNGKKWHQRRKIITPAFHFTILKSFTEIMEAHGETFIGLLKQREGEHVDIVKLLGLFTLDVIGGEWRRSTSFVR